MSIVHFTSEWTQPYNAYSIENSLHVQSLCNAWLTFTVPTSTTLFTILATLTYVAVRHADIAAKAGIVFSTPQRAGGV